MSIYHNHHIIPKHMNGSDDPSNIERITIEEHAQRHKELYEKHGYEQDRIAWLMLSGQIDRAEAIKLSQKAPKSERWKSQARERMIGENNPMYGKTFNHTEDAKNKISQGISDWLQTEEGKEHLKRLNWTGRKHTEESKQKQSQSRKGKGLWKGTDRIPPHTGFKQTEKQKQSVKNANSCKWQVTTPTGEVLIIINLTQFCKDNGLDQGNLSRGTHKKYRAIRLTGKGQV